MDPARGSQDRSGHRPGFSTRAIHEGDLPPGGIAEQPVSPPVWLTSDYLYDGLEHYADVINERRPGYVYGRYGNPTHTGLHRVLASLDGAEAAWSFASGMAAIHTSLTSLVKAGQHLVAQRTIYGGTFALLTEVFPGYGIDVTFADPEVDDVAGAIRPGTRAVLIETLANPTFRVSDVAGIAELCADRGLALVVDNTIPTPFLLRPLERPGVTLVVHSTTKYVGGHSDLIGGAVVGSRDRIEAIRRLAMEQGTTAGAFESWLVLRGVQTLALRMERQCANALALAQALEEHDVVVGVGYAGLPSHQEHARGSALFDGPRFGAMLSLTLKGGYQAGLRMCDALRVARVGSSFGSMHSQVCHPATTSHRQLSASDRDEAGIGDGLLRVAVGGEDPEDLVEDFLQALQKVD
jgi:cystathionine beta-lyase/cystathionine gamma-synthase